MQRKMSASNRPFTIACYCIRKGIMKYLIFVLLLVSPHSFALQIDDAFEVSDVTVGLANFDNKTIYLKTDNVKYQENGTCMVAGKQKKCLMWALSFKYAGAGNDTELSCDFKTSQKGTRVDVYNAYPEKIDFFRFIVKLPPGDGIKFLPSYANRDEKDAGVVKTDIECLYRGKLIFDRSFSIDLDR